VEESSKKTSDLAQDLAGEAMQKHLDQQDQIAKIDQELLSGEDTPIQQEEEVETYDKMPLPKYF